MAKTLKRRIVLYFLSGARPTAAQEAQIEELFNAGREVKQRNAGMIGEEAVEAFDELGGDVPKRYLEAAAETERKVHEAPSEIEGQDAPAPVPATPVAEKVADPAPAAAPAAPTPPAKPAGWKPNA